METELNITTLVYQGYGLGRSEGKVWFVPFTAPGDRILAVPVREKKNLVYGKMTALLEPGEGRVEAPCPSFGRCGGCHWQHLSYPFQLKAKEDILKDFLSSLKNPPPVLKTIPCPNPYNYRSRILLQGSAEGWGFYAAEDSTANASASASSTGGTAVGSADLAEGSSENRYESRDRRHSGPPPVVPIKSCLLAAEQINQWLKTPPVRRDSAAPRSADRSASVHGSSNGTGAESLGDADTWELRLIEDSLVHTTETYFSQVNPQVNRLLREEIVRQARQLAEELGSGENRKSLQVGDLYCGDGNLCLPLAEEQADMGLAKIRGWDNASASIGAARKAAEKISSPADIRFFCRTIEKARGEISRELNSADLLILDPPRRGLKGVTDFIVSLGVGRVLYVSCSPPDMIRDVKAFEAAGYEMTEAVLFDMFPQTYHMECLAVLNKKLK
jgi:23S rRNA (uracil1939-C5)-methyltransferase